MDPDLSIDMPKYDQLVIYEDYKFSFLDVWIIAECVLFLRSPLWLRISTTLEYLVQILGICFSNPSRSWYNTKNICLLSRATK